MSPEAAATTWSLPDPDTRGSGGNMDLQWWERIINPEFHDKARLLILRGEKENVELRGSPRMHLGASVSLITVQDPPRHSWPDKAKATKGPGRSGTKVWIKVLAKGKGNLDWAAAEGNDIYQLEMQIQTTLRDHFSPIR